MKRNGSERERERIHYFGKIELQQFNKSRWYPPKRTTPLITTQHIRDGSIETTKSYARALMMLLLWNHLADARC